MKTEDLRKLKELLTAYKADKCKTYKETFKHCLPCSDCPAQGIFFDSDGDIVGRDCMVDTLTDNIGREIEYYRGFSNGKSTKRAR